MGNGFFGGFFGGSGGSGGSTAGLGHATVADFKELCDELKPSEPNDVITPSTPLSETSGAQLISPSKSGGANPAASQAIPSTGDCGGGDSEWE